MDLQIEALIDAVLRADPQGGQDATRELVDRGRAGSDDVLAALQRRLLFRGGTPRLAALLGEFAGNAPEAGVIDALVLMLRDRDEHTRKAAGGVLKELAGQHRVAARLAQWVAEPQGWPVAARQQIWALLADRGCWVWPGDATDVRLLAAVAARDRDTCASTARVLLFSTLRAGGFEAAVVEALGAEPGGREILLRIVVEIDGAASDLARDRLLRLASLEPAGVSRWAEAIDVPGELRRLAASDAETRRDAASILGAFRVQAGRAALELALHDPVPAVREAAARALAKIASNESRAALEQAVSASRGTVAPDAETALAAAFDALAVVGDIDSLKFFLTLADEASVRRAHGATAVLARRLGEPATVLAREMLERSEAPPLALSAFGAAGGAEAVPLLAVFLGEARVNAMAALGATRAAAAVPELMPVIAATNYGGYQAADILRAASAALAEVLAHDARSAANRDLVAIAELADTVVPAGARGFSTRMPINHVEAREHAGAELARRGLPIPPARGLTRLASPPRRPAPESVPEPRPARIVLVGACPECGEPLLCDARLPGAYAVACHASHRREVRAEYAPLAFDAPLPDIPLATHFARCTGAALPFEMPPGSGPLALERRGGAWVETQAGTPEADRPFPELERGNLAAAPWRVKPDRQGVFLAGFVSAGMTTVFRVLDIGADRVIFLTAPFGGVDAQEADLARQAPDVARLARVYTSLAAELGDRVAYLHAIHDRGRGYCGFTLPDGRVIHHEGPLLVDDVEELWTPCLLPSRCPRCQAAAPAMKVPTTAVAYVTAPIEVEYRCGRCRHAFSTPWPAGSTASSRPPAR